LTIQCQAAMAGHEDSKIRTGFAGMWTQPREAKKSLRLEAWLGKSLWQQCWKGV
jgi:hypothetical protein